MGERRERETMGVGRLGARARAAAAVGHPGACARGGPAVGARIAERVSGRVVMVVRGRLGERGCLSEETLRRPRTV